MSERDDGLESIARAIQWLGNAEASTPMGGLEALGAVILESNNRIAEAIGDLALAVRYLAEEGKQT